MVVIDWDAADFESGWPSFALFDVPQIVDTSLPVRANIIWPNDPKGTVQPIPRSYQAAGGTIHLSYFYQEGLLVVDVDGEYTSRGDLPFLPPHAVTQLQVVIGGE